MRKYLSFIFILFAFVSFSQNEVETNDTIQVQKKDTLATSTTIGGGLDFNYKNTQKYTLGTIRVDGADNFDHQAIKLIAGLKQGEQITIPSDRITNAIKNLWTEGLFSQVSIDAEKEVAGVIYLVIKLTPRPKLSRFKFTGASKHDVDKIREIIDLNSGKTITENLLFTTKSKIKGYYLDKGCNNATIDIVRVRDTLINNAEIFFININKGKMVCLKISSSNSQNSSD